MPNRLDTSLPSAAVSGRNAFFRHLEHVAAPGTLGDLGADAAQRVDDFVRTCFDASEHHIAPAPTQPLLRSMLTAVKERTDLGDIPAQLEALMHVKAPDAATSPDAAARTHLNRIAAAASDASTSASISPQAVVSNGNAVLGPVLHTGDEIWAAAAALIADAEKSVQLHTWGLTTGSEAAKHIMLGLCRLQARRAAARAVNPGQPTDPIRVELVVGYHRQYQGAQPVVTFDVDPTLLAIEVRVRRPLFRGAAHTKTVLVDGVFGIVTSANVKNLHHVRGADGTPMHDFGLVVVGPVVQEAMAQDFASNASSSALRLSHVATAARTQADIDATLQQAEAQQAPLPLEAEHAARIAQKLAALQSDIQQWKSNAESLPAVRFVALAKAPLDRPFAANTKNPLSAGTLAAIRGATGVEIVNCNVNARPLVKALKSALDKGASVDILTPQRCYQRVYGPLWLGNRDIYMDLVNHITKKKAPGTLRLRWFTGDRGEGFQYSGNHTKAMFINKAIAGVGSANSDKQSLTYSGEFALWTDAPHVVKPLRQGLFTAFWDTAAPFVDTSLLKR